MLRSLPISPLSLFAIPGDRTPNLTMILITTDHYTPYPKYCPWSRPMHSLMAVHHLDSCTALWLSTCCLPHVHLMSIPCTAIWLFTSCLPHVYLIVASCSPHGDPFTMHIAQLRIGTPCISSPLCLHSITPIHPHAPLMLYLMYSSWLTFVL